MSDDMKRFNQLVEEADKVTGYAFDVCDVRVLVASLEYPKWVRTDKELRLAQAIRLLAIELGLWRH